MLVLILLSVLLLVTPAAAQTAMPLVAGGGWSEAISSSLNQGAVSGGLGGFLYLVWRIGQVLQAQRVNIEARTVDQGETSTASRIREAVSEGAGVALNAVQAKIGATGVPKVGNGALDKGLSHVQQSLTRSGVALDSDVIRGKLRAAVAQMLLNAVANRFAPPPAPPNSHNT